MDHRVQERVGRFQFGGAQVHARLQVGVQGAQVVFRLAQRRHVLPFGERSPHRVAQPAQALLEDVVRGAGLHAIHRLFLGHQPGGNHDQQKLRLLLPHLPQQRHAADFVVAQHQVEGLPLQGGR